MTELVIYSPDEMLKPAREIMRLAASRSLFLLYGSLGAGKTSLVKKLGELLSVEDTVTSPTFSLINEYQTKQGNLFHIDLYRLESLEEAIDIGIEEYLYRPGICMIEWPEIIETIVPAHYKIHIEIIDNSIRKVIFS